MKMASRSQTNPVLVHIGIFCAGQAVAHVFFADNESDRTKVTFITAIITSIISVAIHHNL